MLKTVSSITNAIGALNFKGTWNASTNTPALASGVGVKGDYYVVGTAGATTLDGVSNWGVGDWATFNGTTWQRVEGGADLNGVNLSYTGTLTGGTGVVDIGSAQIYKTADGKLGIGFSAPPSRVSIKGAGSYAVAYDEDLFQILDPSGLNNAKYGFFINQSYPASNAAGTIALGAQNSNNHLYALSIRTADTERIHLASNGPVAFPSIGTTASAANAFLDTGTSPANRLLVSTSSIKYKTDVESLDSEKADAILSLRPVWYRSTAEADRSEWSWYGLIAEEVAEIEPRLVHYKYNETDYEDVIVKDEETGLDRTEKKLKSDAKPIPNGVQYERLSVLLIDVIKRQEQRIQLLETKMASLIKE